MKQETEKGILTVGQMIEFLSNYKDDVHIIISLSDDVITNKAEWANVVSIEDATGESYAITLTTADTFDARQF